MAHLGVCDEADPVAAHLARRLHNPNAARVLPHLQQQAVVSQSCSHAVVSQSCSHAVVMQSCSQRSDSGQCGHAVSSHAAYLGHQLRLLLWQVVVLWYKVARLLPNLGLELFVAVPQFVLPVQSRRGRETIHLEKRK